MSIRIDPEFKALIPPLSPDEYKQLEENILAEGIRDPLVVWETLEGDDILIDGHNRWEISAKHSGIPFEVTKHNFNDRDEVKAWIIKNQLGRRNINNFVRSELVLLLKPTIAAKAKENQLRTLENRVRQKSDKQEIDTKKELAKAAGVSHDTIHKVEVIAKKAPEDTKDALRRGELSINEVYSGIRASEVETRKQQETRELKEAKKRHEEFQEQKKEGVVNFADAAKDKEDKRLIYEELEDIFYKLDRAMFPVSDLIEQNALKEKLKGATYEELLKVFCWLRRWRSITAHVMRVVEEVKDEKQSDKALK